MAANCAGIVGGQLLQASDKPYYHRGFTVILALISIALTSSIVGICQYAFINSKNKALHGRCGGETEGGDTLENPNLGGGVTNRKHNF